VLVAGACVWIISWEDEDETKNAPTDDTLVGKSKDTPPQ
jgi:hypothetical protein